MFKTYNIVVLFGFVLLSASYIIGYSTLVFAGLQVKKVPFQVLFDHQVSKLNNTNAEIIFVGDSSLGNAINANLFSTLSGQTSQNYALTGAFGFKGSLSMAKAAQNPKLKTIIIVQTLDMFKRAVAKDYHPPKHVWGIDLSAYNFTALKAFVKALKNRKIAPDQKFSVHNDYIKQGKPKAADVIYSGMKATDINEEKIVELQKIADYCHKKKLRCVYAHGPIVEDVCLNSSNYIHVINDIIRGTGLPLTNPEPICIPKSKLGDSKDHVRSPFKDEYTKKYFEFLKLYL